MLCLQYDDSDNATRFLVLAREPIIPGTDRLFKIKSRPLQKQALQTLDDNNNGFPKRFPYLFYVDFEASMADQKAQNALGHLKEDVFLWHEIATFLRVLGSYPADISMS
ncbi:hypothetical protein HYC85_031807 [Camellia sinensis]|uniref:Uncharacterized protein n=1 Tax=Camellia sinensis TaxID=4442 RepID=A0A7J7FVF9_CAMSI|nr:hypothetical protein HYC85_031807 [Camellia sinensis]